MDLVIKAVRDFLKADVWSGRWKPCKDHFNPCRGVACCEFGAAYDALEKSLEDYDAQAQSECHSCSFYHSSGTVHGWCMPKQKYVHWRECCVDYSSRNGRM